MSDDSTPPERPTPLPFAPPPRRRHDRRHRGGEQVARLRVKKLRFLSVLVGLGALGVVSLVFGLFMAVASDLPQLQNKREYGHERNSYLYDDQGNLIGQLAPPDHEVVDTFDQLGKYIPDAIISTEDKRFYTDSGVDLRGVARAFIADATGHSTEGASTITQQFVKNALAEEDNRTVFEKIREAALAFHLTHEWSKQKILTEYLNSIYFGNGAYGAESAARVYFGRQLGYDPDAGETGDNAGCGDSTPTAKRPSCASRLDPAQAALLAGMVANPTAFNPIYHKTAAKARRDLVLQNMVDQGYISRTQYDESVNAPLPTESDLLQPGEPPGAPYFTSWLMPQILDAVGLHHGLSARQAEFRAYYGGLKIHTTIDLKMQEAAVNAIDADLPTGSDEPTASLVAIDNKTGQIRAMVGGPLIDGKQDYDQYPFNLATEGRRQPGSAFKPFTLAVAFEKGYSEDSVFDSRPIDIQDPKACGQAHYRPHNFDDEYEGEVSLYNATAQSDNSVFTQLGLAVGVPNVKAMARKAGIASPISNNCSIIIGGLKIGVSPLDMAHAYETFAENGRRVYDPVLGSSDKGAIGIASIDCTLVKCRGKKKLVSHPAYEQVMPAAVAEDVHNILEGVVKSGTGQAAAIPGVDVVGKTGTTNDEGDAWFVGWTPQITTAVWVGFPNKLVPMLTQFEGGPVTGGTFPAEIWKTFTESALSIETDEAAAKASHPSSSSSTTETAPATYTGTSAATVPTVGSTATAPQNTDTAPQNTATAPANQATTPANPATTPVNPATTPATTPVNPATTPVNPATTPAPAPTPTPTPTQGTGTSGGAGIGGG